MTTPVIRYYPSLADVVALEELPDELGFIKDGITNVFSNLYYKDLQFSKGPLGDSAFYSLKIISNERIDFEIPLTGAFIVINPDDDSDLISSFQFGVVSRLRYSVTKSLIWIKLNTNCIFDYEPMLPGV